MAGKPQNIAHKILESHLVGGTMTPGEEIQLKVDHLLMQDALSALTMLALEAMEQDRIKIKLACQYVDHNLFQADFRNPDDHVFLRSCCRRFGMNYSAPGNGISHPTHQERFGVPGKLLVGGKRHALGGTFFEPTIIADNGRILVDTRLSDHAPFWDKGFPALMITDTAYFRNHNYHGPNDTADTLDYAFMAELVRSLEHAVDALALPAK